MTYQPSPDDQHSFPLTTQTRPKRTAWFVLAGVAILMALGAGAYLVWGRDAGPTLTAAEATCNRGRSGAEIADGGKTLIIDMRGTTPGEQIRGAMDADTVACILNSLKAPSAVVAHINGTRALDGRQTDSWDGFAAAWTYHPEHGMQMTIEAK